jgi:ABC-2 type transport system ATP-binding protein
MTDFAIRLGGVSMQYPHFALRDIDLDFQRGSILGLIGPNGAGKSTTIRIIMGLLRPDAGTVEVLGHDMLQDAATARWKIGYASEDLRLYRKMSLGWHMQFIKEMFRDWDDDYAAKLLQRFDLRPELKIGGLSHGQRVKASLLLILARRPDLLVLDEPTTGLDPVARMEVLNEMMEVLMDERRSVLFSSHNTADVEQLSDQIAFIDRGRLVANDDKERFLENWRRLRIQCPAGELPAACTGMVDVRRQGSLAILTTNAFCDALPGQLTAAGVRVDAVERLTLEEIFVAEVAAARRGSEEEAAL